MHNFLINFFTETSCCHIHVYPHPLQFNVMFSFSRGDVQQDELTSESAVREYASKLSVEYSTGAKQVCSRSSDFQ